MEKVYVGSIIADIHSGAIPPLQLLNELKSEYIDKLSKLNILDFVVIAGDLFDTKISLNSEHTRVIFTFLKLLINVCIEKNAKLRIIKGTESHDNKQLELLNLMSTNCDIKIINTVTSEDLFDDMKVLYVPEEYMTDYTEYYKDYMDDEYDMIFGHGLFNEVAFASKLQASETTMSRAPIFKSEDFINICKGPIFFGHIHKKQVINGRIYYVGSFSRWVFGEEEDKGSMIVAYTPETSNYKVDFIENKLARTFTTMIINESSTLYKNESCDINLILNLIESVKADKVRLIFNIPKDYQNAKLLQSLIRDTFSKNPNIKIIINNNSVEDKAKKERIEKIQKLVSTYDFIFNNNIPLEEKIVKYIKIRHNRDIDISDMRDYLYQKLNF